MGLITWLKVAAIGLPLIGALTLWHGAGQLQPARRWLSVAIIGLVGLLAAAVFSLDRQYVCVVASGEQGCLFGGLASLSIIALSALLLWNRLKLRRDDQGSDGTIPLLLIASWAGIGFADNLFLVLVFVYLFLFTVNRWMSRRGLRWSLFVVRDDFGDQRK